MSLTLTPILDPKHASCDPIIVSKCFPCKLGPQMFAIYQYLPVRSDIGQSTTDFKVHRR